MYGREDYAFHSPENYNDSIRPWLVTNEFGYAPEPLSPRTIYNTLVVGKQPPNYVQAAPLRNDIPKNMNRGSTTVPIEHSYSKSYDESSYYDSCSDDSVALGPQSRVHDFDSTPLPKARAPNRKGSLERIACAAESMENDLFSMLQSLQCRLGFPEPDATIKGGVDEDEVKDEDEVPINRLYADLRKQRLRNQVLSYERDTLNRQLEERNQEIQQMVQRLREQDLGKVNAEEQALRNSEKIAEMMNDLLEIQRDMPEYEGLEFCLSAVAQRDDGRLSASI
jgi:hypothetical protein